VGLWAVTNANTYSGGTAVTAGTLYANSTTGSTTGSGTVAVTNGGTLSGGTLSGGNGMIAPSGTNGITVTSGGSVTPGGVQTPVGTYASYTGGPTNVVNGSITLSTANITASSTVLAMAPNSSSGGLTFALGAGGAGVTNSHSSVSQLLVSGSTANIMNFNIGGTAGPGGTSTVVTINDLIGNTLTLSSFTADINSEYVLIQGNGTTMANGTVYEDNGTELGTGAATGDLGATTALGQQILGGLTLLTPTGSNYFSEEFSNAQIFLNGDDIVLAVPEPGTWALMLGGFGLLVLFQRRKQNKTR